jgi:hypothetical protein
MGKNGRILFDRPKPTAGCSASGRRRIIVIDKMSETQLVHVLFYLQDVAL